MMANEYKCAECANGGTPICERCVYITRPDGSTTKPTYFIKLRPAELTEDMSEEEKLEAGVTEEGDLAVRMIACLVSEVPIPLKYVMRYNKIMADKENELLPPSATAPLSLEGGFTGETKQ
jgi:hypothetical protein